MQNPMILPLTAAVLGAAAVMLCVNVAATLMRSRNRMDKLKERVSGERKDSDEAGTRKVIQKMAESAGRIGEKFAPSKQEEVAEASNTMVRAGIKNPNATRIFWGVKAALAILGMLGGAAVKILLDLQIQPAFFALLLLFPAVLGLYLPNVWLSRRVTRRHTEIGNALPDALDLLVVCVEAGMGLDQALARISHEMRSSSPALAGEFKTVILELRAGKARSEALKNLSARVGIADVNSLVTLIVQADSFGTSIAATLRVYSDHMRTTRFQRAEEMAAKLPVKLLFPLVFSILPALFVAIIGPAGIHLAEMFTKMN